MIYVEETYLDDPEKSLELVTVTFTGDSDDSALPVKGALRNQGMWPGRSPLNQGQRYVALVPDDGLSYLESHQEIEVDYDPATAAETILDFNFMPTKLYSRKLMDERVQERVFDALGVEWQGMDETANKNELRRVCGRDLVDEREGADPPKSFATEVQTEYTRRELIAVAREFGGFGGSPDLAGKRELAEYVSSHEPGRVYSTLEALATADEDGEEVSA
ncbi:hypothetical protein [Haladaptatus sp. NG-SE-30]